MLPRGARREGAAMAQAEEALRRQLGKVRAPAARGGEGRGGGARGGAEGGQGRRGRRAGESGTRRAQRGGGVRGAAATISCVPSHPWVCAVLLQPSFKLQRASVYPRFTPCLTAETLLFTHRKSVTFFYLVALPAPWWRLHALAQTRCCSIPLSVLISM